MSIIIINCALFIFIYFAYKYILKKALSSMFIKIDILRLYAFIIAPSLLILVNLICRCFFSLGSIHLVYTFIPILLPVIIIVKERIDQSVKKKYYLKYQENFKTLIIKESNKKNISIKGSDIAISFRRYKKRTRAVIYIKIYSDKFDDFELQSNIENKLKSEFNNIDFKVLFG